MAGIPHGVASMFYQSFRRAPAGKEILLRAAAGTKLLELLRCHETCCQSLEVAFSNSFDIYPDGAVVKCKTETIARMADIKVLEQAFGFAVRSVLEAYILSSYGGAAGEFLSQQGADERITGAAAFGLLLLIWQQDTEISSFRR